MARSFRQEPTKEPEPVAVAKPLFEFVDLFPERKGDVTQTFRADGDLALAKASDILALIKLSSDMGFNHSGAPTVILCGADTFLMPAIVELAPRMDIEFAPRLGDREIKLITR